jgi:hypothetical protein
MPPDTSAPSPLPRAARGPDRRAWAILVARLCGAGLWPIRRKKRHDHVQALADGRCPHGFS